MLFVQNIYHQVPALVESAHSKQGGCRTWTAFTDTPQLNVGIAYKQNVV